MNASRKVVTAAVYNWKIIIVSKMNIPMINMLRLIDGHDVSGKCGEIKATFFTLEWIDGWS